jgi:hypothetical protein
MSSASESLWDSAGCPSSQTVETWGLPAIAAPWERAGATNLRAKSIALVTICSNRCAIPGGLGARH